MSTWRRALHAIVRDAETTFETLERRLVRRLGRKKPILILPFRGHGTPDRIYLTGRVLRSHPLQPADDLDTVWDNLLATYRRLESDEVPDVKLTARYAGAEIDAVSDDEGYFKVELSPRTVGGGPWRPVEIELREPIASAGAASATGEVLIPPAGSDFGVISDVDDTILQTGATSLLKMARLTFFNNARTRLPFKGVAEFYQALQAGPDGDGHNPIFFVSSSPWNLYDLLVEFMEVHDIPAGPLFLQDYGIDESKFLTAAHGDHKLAQIRHIFETHRDLQFLLIGDSGQKDPEIYRQVVEEHPGRVLGIYLRDVSLDERDAKVGELVEELVANRIEVVFAADTAAAAEHAAEVGWIRHAEVAEVEAGTRRDEAAPSELEQILDPVEDGAETPEGDPATKTGDSETG